MAGIRAVVTDIEGTTTPIRFVHDTLFPYARAALPGLLRDRAGDPEIAGPVGRVREAVPGRDPVETLLAWMDEDRKAEPLKTLQGIAWREAYRSGVLHADLYPDVPPALRRWHGAGRVLSVYSSGSIEAQRLIFGHTPAGDLTPLFAAFFDTTTGPKREADSYRSIARHLDHPPGHILFLSDVAAELDAAAAAGLATCQLLRPADGATPSPSHPHAADFTQLELLLA